MYPATRRTENGHHSGETIPDRQIWDQAAVDRERARLEGVTLAVREMAYRVNNHITPAVCILAMLQRQTDLAPDLQQQVHQALMSLYAAADDIRKFQRVDHIETVDTPFGPTLDLDRSISGWPFAERRRAGDS